MDIFADYIEGIQAPDQREKFAELIAWVRETFPTLEERIAWGMPTFTDHGTFIISFNVTKKALAFSPEGRGIQQFAMRMSEAGWKPLTMKVNIPWSLPIDYNLLAEVISFNVEDKRDVSTYWRPAEKAEGESK